MEPMFKFFGVGEENGMNIEEEVYEKLDGWDIGQIAVDILENDYEIIIIAPIAGIELEDIDVSFHKSVLTISGNRQKPSEYSESMKLRSSECYWWKFARNIILPENLDFDSIKATMENNLLHIVIKKIKFESQNIKINRIEI